VFRIKTEVYYQYLFDAPVEKRPTFFSVLNEGADFGIAGIDSLENKGTGYNYGFEFTAEKFYSKGYYFLFTASLFESKYKGSDGVERSTAFNGNFVFNLLGGKEWTIRKKNTISINIKTTYAGVVTIEDDVILWGQVGVQKDLTIGKGAVVLGQSGVGKTLDAGKTYFGSPTTDARLKMRELALMKRLPEVFEFLDNKE
ncbi:MAG TPA: hypothetical protein PKX86_02930, partial [Bacteroidia bacterium]|nr:hypothetical protein [Bacteroidia bacterium]